MNSGSPFETRFLPMPATDPGLVTLAMPCSSISTPSVRRRISLPMSSVSSFMGRFLFRSVKHSHAARHESRAQDDKDDRQKLEVDNAAQASLFGFRHLGDASLLERIAP